MVKTLQRGLKEFNLVLNEEKTTHSPLPEGIFREWKSKYHLIRPKYKRQLKFDQFKELYLGVLRIDNENPETGMIDTFISDITNKRYKPLIPCSPGNVPKTISLLLLLAERRIRSFPKILGVVESMMESANRKDCTTVVQTHLNKLLTALSRDAEDNRYQISWILYFLKSNNLPVRTAPVPNHPVLASIQANRGRLFHTSKDFRLFRGVRTAKRTGSLLKHLDVFRLQCGVNP